MEYVKLNPKDVRQLASSISSEMYEEMKQTISDRRPYAFMQFKVGEVFIEVEIPAWETPTAESVAVIHPNYEHRSPRIEEAISKALPSWNNAEWDAQEESRQWDEQMEYQWRNLRS